MACENCVPQVANAPVKSAISPTLNTSAAEAAPADSDTTVAVTAPSNHLIDNLPLDTDRRLIRWMSPDDREQPADAIIVVLLEVKPRAKRIDVRAREFRGHPPPYFFSG